MTTIINPWKLPRTGKDYNCYNPKFIYGDYAIYKLSDNDFLYTYQNKAFSELAGYNETHLKSVADRTGSGFLYDRALETLSKYNLKEA
jgi:hypothetical protein